jgi:hypothetical protein
MCGCLAAAVLPCRKRKVAEMHLLASPVRQPARMLRLQDWGVASSEMLLCRILVSG